MSKASENYTSRYATLSCNLLFHMYSNNTMKHVLSIILFFSLSCSYSQTMSVNFPGLTGFKVNKESLISNPTISFDSVYTVQMTFLQVYIKGSGHSQTIKNIGNKLNQQSVDLVSKTKSMDKIILTVVANPINGRGGSVKSTFLIE